MLLYSKIIVSLSIEELKCNDIARNVLFAKTLFIIRMRTIVKLSRLLKGHVA